MFGYDIATSGGVASMDEFQEFFFPEVYEKKKLEAAHRKNAYCKYDNEKLQLFASPLYMAGVVATFFASYTTKYCGRKPTMLIAALFFIAGVVLNTAALNLLFLIAGRILLGCEVGFATQVIIGVLLGKGFKEDEQISRSTAIMIVVPLEEMTESVETILALEEVCERCFK